MRRKRALILVSSAAVLAIAAAAVFPQDAEVKKGFEMDTALKVSRDLQEILYYAELAPNSHNAQMWKEKIQEDGMEQKITEVMLDPDRSLRQVDPADRESYISLGAFLENLNEAAQGLGYQAEISLYGTKNATGGIAGVKLVKSPGLKKSEEPLKRMEGRCTYRGAFKRDALSETDRKALLEAAQGSGAYFPLSGAQGVYISEGLVQANIQQAADDVKQREFSRYVRFSPREAQSEKDGIIPKMMGLTGLSKWFVTHFMNPESVMSDSFRSQTGPSVKNQAENCAGFFIITGGNSMRELLQTGGLL